MAFEQYKDLVEITTKRTYNQKVYATGKKDEKRYRIHTAHIHYKDGNFKDIDTTLAFDNIDKAWKHSKASYYPSIPEYADGWFGFYNAYKGANHTIKAKPICSHIKGVINDNIVLYKDAFGKGIDLEVSVYWGGLRKVICINKRPLDTSKDLVFDFELDLGSLVIKDKDNISWDKKSILDFKDRTVKIGETGKESYFRSARIWDSKEAVDRISCPVDIVLYKNNGKLYLRKTIKAEILQKAIYPLYTDHPTSYYSASSDGHITKYGSGWDTQHDATTGNAVVATGLTFSVVTGVSGTTYYIYRLFCPVDTSGIGSDTVTAATLYAEPAVIYNQDNDGNDWVNLVQSSEADPTSLATSDFDACGAVDDPTEGSTRIDIGDMSTGVYQTWIFNDLSWIITDGYTKIGLRTGDDCLDNVPGTGFNEVDFLAQESTGNSPYLDVTVEAAPTVGGFMTTNTKYWGT